METATVETRPATGAGAATIADLLPAAVEKYGSEPAVMYRDDSGEWTTRSFVEVGDQVRRLSLGLIDLGVRKGAKVVIVEDSEQLDKIRQVRDRCPKLEHVIRMTGSSDDAISADDVAKRGASHEASEWEERWRSVTPDDICTFIYTSGTTGPPKGCVLSHGNYRAMVNMSVEQTVLESGRITYLYLPLAHSFALLIQLLSFAVGGTLAYWERDPLKILPNLAEVKPHYFPSVPRIFEKIYTAANSRADKAGGVQRAIFNWAVGV